MASAPPTNEFSTVEDKMEVAEGKKAAADKAFRDGNWQSALRSYHEALLYLSGLDKKGLPTLAGVAGGSGDSKPDETKTITKVDQLIGVIQSNMAACHLKTENYNRALYYAEKVTEKNPDNTKMQFRKAKALAGIGYTEKAIKILEDLVSKNQNDALFKSELAAVRIKDKEAEKKSYGKFRGFLGTKPSTIQVEEAAGSSNSNSNSEPKIQEIS